MSTFARRLFDRLTRGDPDRGTSASDEVLAHLNSNRPEHEYIDCKAVTLKHAGTGVKGDASCREHFSQAVCGFYNTRGGVILWGAADPDSGLPAPELIEGLVLDGTDRADDFCEWLFRNGSDVARPPVEGCDFRTIEVHGANGPTSIVVMFVPEREGRMPVRTGMGPPREIDRYYFRTADGFARVPADFLSALFMRQPDPIVVPIIDVQAVYVNPDSSVRMQLRLLLSNEGIGMATQAYAVINRLLPTEMHRFQIDRATGCLVVSENVVLAGPNIHVPPGTRMHFATFTLDTGPLHEGTFVEFRVEAGAGHSMKRSRTLRATWPLKGGQTFSVDS